jgi:hypothetical protein
LAFVLRDVGFRRHAVQGAGSDGAGCLDTL